MERERIIAPEWLRGDGENELAIRPRTFSEYLGLQAKN